MLHLTILAADDLVNATIKAASQACPIPPTVTDQGSSLTCSFGMFLKSFSDFYFIARIDIYFKHYYIDTHSPK